MRSTGQKQAVDLGRTNLPSYAPVIGAIVILTPVIYFASIVPVLKAVFYTEEYSSIDTVRSLYRPLFHFLPSLTHSYLKLGGVSDLEVFFVIQLPQGRSN